MARDRLAVDDQADEEGRAADVGGDDVAVAELLGRGATEPTTPPVSTEPTVLIAVAGASLAATAPPLLCMTSSGPLQSAVAQPVFERAEVVAQAAGRSACS